MFVMTEATRNRGYLTFFTVSFPLQHQQIRINTDCAHSEARETCWETVNLACKVDNMAFIIGSIQTCQSITLRIVSELPYLK